MASEIPDGILVCSCEIAAREPIRRTATAIEIMNLI
jgi:hypothetical protein